MSVVFSPDGTTVASGAADHTLKLWRPELNRRWNLAAYLQGWVSLERAEMVGMDEGDNRYTTAQLQMRNVPPGTLAALYGKDLSEAARHENALNILLRAENWRSASLLWQHPPAHTEPSLPLRQSYLLSLAAATAEDLATGVYWRAEWLGREVVAACTPEALLNPAVSLATLRLAREINSSSEVSVELREKYLSRVRALAPPEWLQALAEQPKVEPASPQK